MYTRKDDQTCCAVEEYEPLCYVSVNIMTSEVIRVVSALGALG